LRKLPGSIAIDKQLQQAGSRWSIEKLYLYSVLFFFVMALSSWLLKPLLPLAFIAGILSAFIPITCIRMQRKKRLTILERQLPEACDLIARSLRAGHAFFSTIKMVADELPDPIAMEFQILSDEINFGDSITEALKRLANRVPLADMRYLIVAVLVQRESGGNLAELMGNISLLIRQRLKLSGDVRALSAEGRLSAWILCLLPFAVFLILSLVNPGYIQQLIEDPAGFELSLCAIAMMAMGVFWMRRIIDIRQ
jgi:tight adherence protein B